MSNKSNKSKSAAVSVISIEDEIAQIEAKRAELLARKEQAEKEKVEAIANAVMGFIPTLQALGAQIADYKGLVAVIRHVENGTLGKSGSSGQRKARVTLSDEDRAKVIEEFKGGAQMSAIVEKWGISSGTAFGLKKEAGMVQPRD